MNTVEALRHMAAISHPAATKVLFGFNAIPVWIDAADEIDRLRARGLSDVQELARQDMLAYIARLEQRLASSSSSASGSDNA